MFRWPIRVKLFAGLSLVVVMLTTLMVGSIFGLHSFHASNLTLTDQLRELGASTRLLRTVVQIDAPHDDTERSRAALRSQVDEAREALSTYCAELRANTSRGNRTDSRDELKLAFEIDHELTAILADLSPGAEVRPILPGTETYVAKHPELVEQAQADAQAGAGAEALSARLDRLDRRAMALPDILHHDFFAILTLSKSHYESSRVIVWVAALAVLAMLCGLLYLVHRWVLYPVRLLHRGVRRVARGAFDYKINLPSGDEMQALAEAFNDMTAQLSATYSDLERQVHERSRQLVRSERLAGVGFLAAGVAHEINNPLASIAFCSEALESRLRPVVGGDGSSADGKVVADYLRMIQDEAFRCKRITERLLDFSRCGEIQRVRTDLGELVHGVVEMVQHMGKYRQKQIRFYPREAVFAQVDPQEIKQVVLNLVVNALDCMEAGGTLKIDVRHAGPMAEMVFEDDGCGMTPEVLENIFEPFFTRRKGGKGTGLGLSITHRIVSQHGGEIGARSGGEGRGSTFVVRLPLRAAESAPAEAVAAARG
jgi:signal transduction histidine kinase